MGSKPTSRTGAFSTSPPSDHARTCAPKHAPRNGTSWSTASAANSFTSLMNGWSSACSTLNVLPKSTAPDSSSSDGLGSPSIASQIRTGAPADESAEGATPNVSAGSQRMSRTGSTDDESTADGTSAALEVASELPVRHAVVVEDDLLLDRRVQQVLEDEVAERLARDLRRAERLDGLVQRRGDAGDVLGLVRVAD